MAVGREWIVVESFSAPGVVMTFCPSCATDWPRDCMSAIAVELLGGCLWCRFGPTHGGDAGDADLARVRQEYQRRKTAVQYVTPKEIR